MFNHQFAEANIPFVSFIFCFFSLCWKNDSFFFSYHIHENADEMLWARGLAWSVCKEVIFVHFNLPRSRSLTYNNINTLHNAIPYRHTTIHISQTQRHHHLQPGASSSSRIVVCVCLCWIFYNIFFAKWDLNIYKFFSFIVYSLLEVIQRRYLAKKKEEILTNKITDENTFKMDSTKRMVEWKERNTKFVF